MLATDPFTERHQAVLRAVKLIRVSKRGKRTDQTFVSPEDQEKKMDDLCVRENFVAVATFREINQSGLRTPFEKRKGLFPATQMIENGEADVIVMAFRDRMARNIVVEGTFQGRVGKAGGRIWAADSGEIKLDTAVERFTSGVLGLMAQMQAEQTAEKTAGPKQRAVDMGVAPFPNIPLGYRRHRDLEDGCTCADRDERHTVVFEPERKLVVRAYEMRAAKAPLDEIRDWLREQGVDCQIRTVQEMLKSRFYLGELHFGKMVNLNAHEGIVNPALWRSIQKLRVARGPRDAESVSTRLLARQGIVHCAHCGRALTVGSQTQRGTVYEDYRCQSMGDCKERVAISATLLEGEVVKYMKKIQAQGRASLDGRLVQAESVFEQADKKLKRFLAITADDEDTDIEEARVRKQELRAERNAARERVDALRAAIGPSLTVTMNDWDDAALERQRRMIRIVIKRIEVRRGSGASRIDIQPFTE
jgi:DNA invertase Pin-like site-specific DNA recombinase